MTAKGDGLLRLEAVMNQLRSPGGCPWDAEQTHQSLVQYLIEETFETIDAIDSGNRDDLLEELGDLLLQVFFHARIAQEHETQPFTIDDVANAISDKLVRRHPHVFPDENGNLASAADAAVAEARWQELKNAEKSRSSVTDGVPVSLPALTQASKLLQRLGNTSHSAPLSPQAQRLAAEIVDSELDTAELMIALIGVMREQGQDPEFALREGVRAFRSRIIESER
ncbi:MAG: hypothetical protein RL410_676 [Actinomycetota bacterium]|jgi:XTP/dITP diphosphohydrolase